MHKHLTHNRTWRHFREFADAVLSFLCDKVPKRWSDFCNSVTDNFASSIQDFFGFGVIGVY